MDRAFSQSKFKDDIETQNTDDILSVILKVEKKNAMKRVFNLKTMPFKQHLLVNWNIERMHSF